MQGLALVAFATGVGEEAFFRGFLQTAIVAHLSTLLGSSWGTVLGVAVASILFGLLHCITPFYFLWATGAGALLGTVDLIPASNRLCASIYELNAQWNVPYVEHTAELVDKRVLINDRCEGKWIGVEF